jgi:hypothetical protein
VIIALEGHEVTFLEGKRIKEGYRPLAIEWDAEIKCRIDGEIQTWKFSQTRNTPSKGKWVKIGQLGIAELFINNKPVRSYRIKRAMKEPQKGELDLNPNVKIFTTIGNATVEQDSFYYLITWLNGGQTNNTVICSLYNFNANEQNVYIRIKPIEGYLDSVGPNDTLAVTIGANGKGYCSWTPGIEIKTGIGEVFAGNIPPGDTFQRRTIQDEDKNLALEKVVTAKFHQPDVDSFTVYFTDQFFQGLEPVPPSYPAIFAGCVKTAAIESWQKQVVEWSLAQGLPNNKPQDADCHHRFFAVDTLNWYHGTKHIPPQQGGSYSAWCVDGSNREVWVRSDVGIRIDQDYTNIDSLTRTLICHEFYHGIQDGYSHSKYINDDWNWFNEGQAQFLPSVQVAGEELKNLNHQYPSSAKDYLECSLNTSLKTVSQNYCLYWRFLYEKFALALNSSGQAKLAIIRDCYIQTSSVGDDPIINGAEAINRAFVKSIPQGKWNTFASSIDSFATACYLKNFTPNNVYVKPLVELNEVELLKKI